MLKRFHKKASDTIKAMERYSKTHDRVWSVPRETAEFLHMLVLAKGAKRVLELGTSIGYSGTWLALALKTTGGRLDTIEVDPDKVERANTNFARAGVDNVATVHSGDAYEVIDQLRAKYDMVFMDAYKADYLRHFRKLTRLLVDGALVTADNALSHAHEIRDFTQFLSRSRTWRSTMVPVGSGVLMISQVSRVNGRALSKTKAENRGED
jgi:predicted O-methyltransferase YrrM